MKKLLIFILSVFSLSAFSQDFQKGTKNLNLGASFAYAGIGANASVDYGITENVSVGAFGGFYNIGIGFGLGNYNYITFGGRAALHLAEYLEEPLGISGEKLDPYIGVALGLGVGTGNSFNGIRYGRSTGLIYGAFLGARYALKPKLGVFAELGYPNSAGVTFKF